MVVDGWTFETPKTRDAVAALAALGVEGRALVVVDRGDENTWKSFANLPAVHVLSTGELNAYDVLVSDFVVFTRDTLPTAQAPAPTILVVEPDADPAGEEEE